MAKAALSACCGLLCGAMLMSVSRLAAHGGPAQAGAGTRAAGVLPCALRNFLSPDLLLMSSPL